MKVGDSVSEWQCMVESDCENDSDSGNDIERHKMIMAIALTI